MPSVTYMNQSGPFWDFIASLEQQGASHPFDSNHPNTNEENRGEGHDQPHGGFASDPWGTGNFFGGQAFPHRGPPPHGPPHHHDERSKEKDTEQDNEKDDENMRDANEHENGEGPSANSGSDNEGGRGRRGRCGGRRRGHCGGRGGRGGMGGRGGPWDGPFGHHGHGPHHRGGPWGEPWGGSWGGPHHGGPQRMFPAPNWASGRPWFPGVFNGPDASAAKARLWEYINSRNDVNQAATENHDHTPDADIFDTQTAYIIHVSLPGAKKEDVGVNWDAEKSEISIAGVIYRPGDEDFLKTLAMNERKVGPFERKIRLGTRATPAHVDGEGITAKLEDGVLRVEVPKLESGYVEIRKVDIE